MRIALAAATLLATILGAPAVAEVRILSSPGGQLGPFIDMFEHLRESGERVVIDGPVTSVVPNDRICVTRRAVLGFHAARSLVGFWEACNEGAE